MAVTPRALGSGTLTSSMVSLVTAPAATKYRISAFTVTNTSASALTFSVQLSASGGTTRLVAKDIPLGAGETKSVTGAIGHVIQASGYVQGSASTTSVVDYYISGYEIV